jgi:predicted GNAT family acetyltransferase
MVAKVGRNEARSRYELRQDDELIGVMDYVERGGTTYLVHTEITPARRGEGQGDVLVQHALDDLRLRGDDFVATCWFVEDFVGRHPEYSPH